MVKTTQTFLKMEAGRKGWLANSCVSLAPRPHSCALHRPHDIYDIYNNKSLLHGGSFFLFFFLRELVAKSF